MNGSDARCASPAPWALDRRTFLGATAATLAAGAAAHAGDSTTTRAGAAPGGRAAGPLNLIFCVSDGMSAGTLTLADMLLQQQRSGTGTRWLRLYEQADVRRAVLRTAAFDSIVTDSAAASTAWGIGRLVNNGAIGLTPEGDLYAPILLRAREAGKATGLVTTTRITHATPAGFIASIPTNRDDEGPIARQILERGVDVALGGGMSFFRDLDLGAWPDVRLVRTRQELLSPTSEASRGRRLLGLFSDSHLPFELDRPETAPTLAEMTSAALERLSGAPGGFILQVEGGRIDHAAHNNDAGALMREQVAFDLALEVAADFALARNDTLLVVTSDHGNANPGLTEYGVRGNRGFARLAEVRHSFEWIMRELAGAGEPTAANLGEVVGRATGVTLEREELDMVLRAARGERVDPYVSRAKGTGPLGSALANHLGVAFVSGNHTADDVELLALGPGSEGLPARLTQPEVHDFMVRALDLPPARKM
ncbi:MAG: alkaline phosphatase [Planctomycetota bacterium]|nr:alkaline phosphatase [Planctomycetota bacterium]